MTRNSLSRPPRRAQPAQVHIPHSSWSRADRGAAAKAPLAADDFWLRLGL